MLLLLTNDSQNLFFIIHRVYYILHHHLLPIVLFGSGTHYIQRPHYALFQWSPFIAGTASSRTASAYFIGGDYAPSLASSCNHDFYFSGAHSHSCRHVHSQH